MAFRFAIGTEYRTRTKPFKLCTVVDRLTTRNDAGEIVRERYVSTHEFCGQLVRDEDVCDTTTARGLVGSLASL